MLWAQISLLALQFLALGVGMAEHGTPKKPGTNNFLTTLIAIAISGALIYFSGGFSRIFGGGQ